MGIQIKNKSRTMLIIGIIMKGVAIAASLYGVIYTLITSGPDTLTYFTILSNLGIDAILFLFLMLDVKDLKNGTQPVRSNTLYILKYVLTVSITITCLVFMFILAPTEEGGIIKAYFGRGATSFCMHLLTPVLAIADFFLFDRAYQPKKIHALFAIIPALAYFGFVVILGQLGMRWREGMIAPYNFINYAAPTGWFGFAPGHASETTLGIGVAYIVPVLIIIFWSLGLLFLRILKGKKL